MTRSHASSQAVTGERARFTLVFIYSDRENETHPEGGCLC